MNIIFHNIIEFNIDYNHKRMGISIADSNKGGHQKANGSWNGAMGLVYKNVCQNCIKFLN